MRKSSKKALGDIDFLTPLNKEKYREMADVDCFGKMYDITTKECNRCTLRDVCCVIFQDAVDLKGKEIEKKTGSKFLNTSNMEALTDKALFKFIKSGETTTKDLIEFCKETANTDDKVAVVNFLKRWIKDTPNVYTKDGLVWIK